MKTATVWAVMPRMPDFSARLEVCWNYYPSSPRREVVQYAKAGLLVPLDEYLTREDRKDFVPKALEYFTYEDELWAFPWAFGNNGMGITNLIYPPMFEEAGVDWKKIVEKGWTMDEFVAVGKKISHDTDGDGENDIFLTGFQGKDPSHLHTDWPWIHNFGGRLLNEAEDKIILDSPETIAGFQFLVDAIYKHKIAPKGAEAADNYGVIKPFHAHKLAMGNGGPYEIGRIDRYFWIALRNTFYYAAGIVPLWLIKALIISVLLFPFSTRLHTIFKSMFYLPHVSSLVIISLIWLWIYEPQYGLLNAMMSSCTSPPRSGWATGFWPCPRSFSCSS